MPAVADYGVIQLMKFSCIRTVLGLLLVLAASLAGVGCAAIVVGGATGAGVAYSMGALKTVETTTVEKAYIAAQSALKQLEFQETLVSKDAIEASVEGETSAGKSVTIRIKRITDQSTEIRIRVGTFGDESLSRLILEKMRTRL